MTRFAPTPRLATPLVLAALLAPVSAQPQARHENPDARLQPAAESRAQFHLPPGFEIQLVAAEPELQKPMNLAFDGAGRVWVTGSTLYPWPARRDAKGELIPTYQKNWDDNGLAFRATSTPPPPPEEGRDSVRILSDFDPATGRARKVTVFAEGLNIPIGVLPLPRAAGAKGDSALVYSIPAIWRLTDTDGDGRADVREKLYDGFGFKDTHGMSSNYWAAFDGWIYGTHGFANQSDLRDRNGHVVSLNSGNTYRFRADGSRFELFTRGQTNPFGLAFDPRGDVYTADSHSKPVYLLVPGGYYEGIGKEHDGLGFAPPITLDEHGSTAIAGIAHYAAPQFPPEYQDNLFNGNPITRRINRTRLDWRGSTPQATRAPDFLTSDDPAFRPVQVKLGPDGALWVADFYNPIIGHYEMPLTHPSRDNKHGRIWRIVWRGLDGSVTPPSLMDLTRETPAALVQRLLAPNLVARTLAFHELLVRADARSESPAIQAAARRLIAGTDPQADATAALPLLFALERLGVPDEALLREALKRPQSDVALAAARVLAARETLHAEVETMLTAALDTPFPPERLARVAAEIFQRHPQPWQAPLILGLLGKANASDTELSYALRLALKTHALTASVDTLRTWAAVDREAPARVADVCLAAPTPAAAEYLLAHLERTKFSDTRAGDFARHAVQQLPAEKLTAVEPLIRALATAPVTQRLALAEGLALVAAKPNRALPPEVDAWLRRELLAALAEKDAALALRAINALRPLALAEKHAPLRRIALDSTIREANRTAAIRALATGTPETVEVLAAVLAGNNPQQLRRTAADLLGTAEASPAARGALVAAYTGASADLTLALSVGLARSEAGAATLLDLVAAGRVRANVVSHRSVALVFEKRSAELRERAAQLTRDLPPEDARLDAVMAQRLRVAFSFKTDLKRGAAVFTAHCATCHRFNNSGGNLGPSLDGSAERSLTRLVEDILDPSRNVDPAFQLTTLTLRSGETRAGFNLREQGGRVLLSDPASGQDIATDKAEITQTTPSAVSPMPPTFEATLTEQEFFDVIEFLRTPAK